MAVKTKIDPIAQDISLIVSETLSPAGQRTAVANFAQRAIDDADQKNRRVLGRIPPRTVTVDGREGARLDSVEPRGGSIIVEYELTNDALIWIAQTLRERSPVISGAFREGWVLLADGVQVDGDQIPVADIYTFVNTVPYARKIEIGKTKTGRDFVIQVPNRIAERTARDAKARFGNFVSVRSSFISLSAGYVLKQNQASRAFTGGKVRVSKKQRPDRIAGSAITYPAITVSLRL